MVLVLRYRQYNVLKIFILITSVLWVSCNLISRMTDIYFALPPVCIHLLLAIHYAVLTIHVVVLQADDNKP